MTDDPSQNRQSARLDALDRRISAARETDKPQQRSGAAKFTAVSMAWRMVFELVASMVIGAAMGWGLDWAFGTIPLFLIVFILLGFAAGVRTVMHSAQELQRLNAAPAADDKSAAKADEV